MGTFGTFSWICTTVVLTSTFLGCESGNLIMQGCGKTWMHLKCPSNDKLDISEVKIVIADDFSNPCPSKIDYLDENVPDGLQNLCSSTENCIYSETICEGKNECAFYLSPHLLMETGQPLEDSQVYISYSCKMGGKRSGGVVALSVIIVILVVAIIVVAVILVRKMRGDSSDFQQFDNDASSQVSVPVGKSSRKEPSATYSNSGIELSTA